MGTDGMNNLTNKSAAELREILQASRETITGLIDSLANRPDSAENTAVHRFGDFAW